jgi:hypothetical protein
MLEEIVKTNVLLQMLLGYNIIVKNIKNLK